MKTPHAGPVMPVDRGLAISDGWKQLFLSLLNATLLLGIVFIALGLILVSKVETFTENVLNDVKLGLLQEIDSDVKGTISAIRTSEQDLKLIAGRLNEMVKHPEITLSPELLKNMRSIRDELRSLQQTAAALPADTASQLTQRIDASIGRSVVTIPPSAQQELAALSHDVKALQKTLAELTSSHASISDHTIRSIASAAAKAIIDIRQYRVKTTTLTDRVPARGVN